MDTDKHIKILIIDPASFIGGAELFMLDFLQFCTNHAPGFSFVVATTGNKDYRTRLRKIKLIHMQPLCLPSLRPWSLRSWLHLRRAVKDMRRLIAKENIQLVVSNSVRANVLSALIAKKENIPICWFMHDFTFPKRLLTVLAKYPRHIICVSDAVRQYILASTHGQVTEKMEVIPNGVDLEGVVKLSLEPLALPLKRQEFWIGLVGRIEPWKGQEYFIRAAKKVLTIVPQARFFIIGSSVQQDPRSARYEKYIKKIVLKEKLTSKVYFTGYLKNIYPLIKQLDILVHTSVEPEPFGRVIIEGMAMKKPVIASPLGGPGQIIQNGEDGFLIDPKDTTRLASCLIDLYQHPEKRNRIVLRAWQKVSQQYKLDIVYRRILSTFRSLVNV